MDRLNWHDKVVVVTGSGGGLGKAYATFFASRGAKVVINDLSRENADRTAKEIVDTKGPGTAIANYDNVSDGGKIIQQALDKWGRIHVLINNAGILRDKSFKGMSDAEFDLIQEVHVKGAYHTSKAAWPVFRKQKFGRVILISSPAGLYGNFGQSNYSAAKMGLVAFAKSLAREGAKYNINVNCVVPVAATAMTETVMPPDMLAQLKPERIVPLVAYLVHDSTDVSGQMFEAGAGWYALHRWQRSKGAVFKTDETFSPAAVKARWDELNDFSKDSTYPSSISDTDYTSLLAEAKSVKSNPQPDPVRYDGQVVLVTGAGAGLGRAYALMYGVLGAKVVVNDMSSDNANAVVEEILKLGGKAIPVVKSVEDGAAIVKEAIDTFGTIHAVVNNAGILRDKAFTSATEAEWDLVYKVHLRGTYSVCKALWPVFLKQKYGRIVNTCSVVGLHGNFGQTNYSTAKSAILGFTQALAIEGQKNNILANIVVPNAGTSMTATIWPEDMVKAFSPSFIAPVVGYLTSETNHTTKGIYEVSGGWGSAQRTERSFGYAFPNDTTIGPEDIKAQWHLITQFDERATHPKDIMEAQQQMFANFSNKPGQTAEESKPVKAKSSGPSAGADYADSEDSKLVMDAKKVKHESSEYTYTERDVALYNLGVGATEKELHLTFEGHQDFQAVPTFAVIPQFETSSGMPLDWLPNFSPNMLLHGEQYTSIKAPIPTSGVLVNEAHLMEVLDKGKAASVTSIVHTQNKATGEIVFENQSTVFIRGSGGFGGKKTGKDRGAATAANKPPNRAADKTVEFKTDERQAAIYRLSGDYNPLHIDPAFAKVGGFNKPILHGLCSFGIAGKHILQAYGPFKDIKTRFSGVVYPGETLVIQMWKEGKKVIFQVTCRERSTPILSAAAATLV